MNAPRLFLFCSALVFLLIGISRIQKKETQKSGIKNLNSTVSYQNPVEVEMEKKTYVSNIQEDRKKEVFVKEEHPLEVKNFVKQEPVQAKEEKLKVEKLPENNRIEEFFRTRGEKLPIVDTITYRSRADWLKGRPAWLSDYASHFKTSRHFIARSLHGKPDYFQQNLAEGDRFNVLKADKELQFYLLIDTSRSKMWFYYLDKDEKDPILVKTYPVSLGRPDMTKESGSLTPYGLYQLGEKVAIYKPKTMGHYQGEKTEMIRVFGTRWIPFEKEVKNCTSSAKGLGIHGSPWIPDQEGNLLLDESGIGKYESDGCIRLKTEDMEELFAIIISRPTFVEIVPDFGQATFLQ